MALHTLDNTPALKLQISFTSSFFSSTMLVFSGTVQMVLMNEFERFFFNIRHISHSLMTVYNSSIG